MNGRKYLLKKVLWTIKILITITFMFMKKILFSNRAYFNSALYKIFLGRDCLMQMPVHIVAAGGFVENAQGDILLVKIRRDGNWVFPGGQIEVGENLIDGVIREVKEESGIDVVVSHLVGVYSNTATYEGHSGVKMVPTKVMFDFVFEPVGGE